MLEKKEDTYTTHSDNVTQNGNVNGQPQYSQGQPYNQQPQYNQGQPYNQQPQYNQGQPYNPQQQYNPGQPYNPQQPYNPGQYNGMPYTPGVIPKKKNNTAKIVIAIISCFVIFIISFFVVFSLFSKDTEEFKKNYEQTGELHYMIDVCDAYDSDLPYVDDMVQAEKDMKVALADTKTFLREYENADCKDYYKSADDAYNVFVADYYYIMIVNGNEQEFISEFVKRMKEVSPSNYYYTDSYTLVGYVAEDSLPLDDNQKLVILRAFDALVDASEDNDELLLTLQEYYDCCESFKLYDKADAIEKQINNIKSAA